MAPTPVSASPPLSQYGMQHGDFFAGRHDAVLRRLIGAAFLDADNVSSCHRISLQNLGQATGVTARDNVRVQHCKRFVADQVPRAPDGVTQTEGECPAARNSPRSLSRSRGLAWQALVSGDAPQHRFDFGRRTEVIFDRVFFRSDDKNTMLNTGGEGLIHHVLNHGLIDNGQHLLKVSPWSPARNACQDRQLGRSLFLFVRSSTDLA